MKNTELNLRELKIVPASNFYAELSNKVNLLLEKKCNGHSIGFTGTRKPKKNYVETLQYIFTLLVEHGFSTVHHGDCLGADYQAHVAALAINLDIVIHPPINEKFRAFTNKLVKDSSSVCYMMNRAPYLTRNRNLVVESDILIALTQNPELEQLRSGTWSTVRYARKLELPIIFV